MLTIQKNLTETNRTVKSGRDIKYIVVHYTGNSGDTAYNNTKYFKSQNRGASAHYFVDKDSIWQCVEDKDVAWHCGTKGRYYHKKCRNANSIGIEMCDSVKRNGVVEDNTAELVRYLMGTYNIPLENVIRHYDVTHKLCPAPLVDNSAWNEFKRKLGGSEEMTNEEKQAFEELERKVMELNTQLAEHTRVYNYISELPSWAAETINKLYAKGIIKGVGGERLELTMPMIRILVMNDNAGVYEG